MATVRITDHVQQASTYDDGQVIFNLIANDVRSGRPVVVSFEGLHAVPSAFINAALLQLVETVPLEQIFRSLQITNSTKFINDMINRRFAFVAEQQAKMH